MTEFIAKALEERKLGLALHYPLIHAAVLGLNAQRTFEFGAGGSTRVFLEALTRTGGRHRSVSTDSQELQQQALWGTDPPQWAWAIWRHARMALDNKTRPSLESTLEFTSDLRFDIVLHDGAHDEETVAGDIAWIWPRLKCFGLLFVHDTQHTHCGEATMRGLGLGLSNACATFSKVTLPFGYGLTIVRKEAGETVEVAPAEAKPSSPHGTRPF